MAHTPMYVDTHTLTQMQMHHAKMAHSDTYAVSRKVTYSV